MATTYNRLDEYMIIQSSKDKINEEQIDFSDYHYWTDTDLKVFIDPVNGSFHILKDMIFQIKETPLGGQTTTNYYKSNTDLIFKNINSINFKISTLYADYRVIKFYTVQAPDKYLGYKNFDNNFNYNRTYSVDTYPWIKTDVGSYRDRMGDWDLNGNTSGTGNHDQIQALCRSLKEAYKISGAPVWPETYKKYAPEKNTWTEYEPTLTNSTSVEEVDHSDTVPRQKVWKWPQRDYLFDDKYITSCDIEPEIRGGKDKSPYQFSQKYKTQFAKTILKGEQPQKIVNRGFTSVKSLSKILQKPIETFNDSSIKFLEISWTNPDTKTECDITASYEDTASMHWTQIPKDRKLGMRIRLPGIDWKYYGEERIAPTRKHTPPIQLPWGSYNINAQTVGIYGTQPRYDWTWGDVRKGRPWYSNNTVSFTIHSEEQEADVKYFKYIPQLKVHFINKYYYVSTKLESLLGKSNRVFIRLYSGQYNWGPKTISFSGTRDDVSTDIIFPLGYDPDNTAATPGEQWGWTVKKLHQDGSMDNWDSGNNIYRISGQTEFNDLYSIKGVSDSNFNTLSGSLLIFNNIDLFGDVDTIEVDSFAKLFNAPKHQINGWITTCDPTGINNGYVVLDWSYNLVLKNRLLPYKDQMFLPITTWKERYFLNGVDEVLDRNLTSFASNKDLSSDNQPFFGYNVGVRVFNASQNDFNRDKPIWEQGPWEGKEFTVRYNQNTWNQVNDLSTELGAYRNRNSMAYQFRNYTLARHTNYFKDPDNLIAPPVGLVLE